jgi:anti-anti-sigma regulatory factor
MYDAIANKQGNLLIIQYSGTVNRKETGKCVELVRSLIPGLKPGFTVITDLGRLTHMDFDCAQDLGTVMDMCNNAGVAYIRRVVPPPDADIGWNIISRFHYDEDNVSIKTYPSFYQAVKTLILEDKIEIKENTDRPT